MPSFFSKLTVAIALAVGVAALSGAGTTAATTAGPTAGIGQSAAGGIGTTLRPSVRYDPQRFASGDNRQCTLALGISLVAMDTRLCRADRCAGSAIPPRAQQVLALALQEAGVGRRLWQQWLGTPFVLGPDAADAAPAIVEYLVRSGFLADDGGILGIGEQAENVLGRRHFMELLSVLTSEPVFSVRHGRNEIGTVPDEALVARPASSAAERTC